MLSHLEIDDILILDSIDSTNLELKRRRDEIEGTNVLLISNEQTAGRGQRGRSWASAKGLGLWMSLHLGRPLHLSNPLHLLSVYTGLILHRVLDPMISADLKLKWPNDLLIHAKKCGGILTEVQWLGASPTAAIIGIGINLRHRSEDFPVSLRESATSLAIEGMIEIDRDKIIENFLNNFFEHIDLLDSGENLAVAWNASGFQVNCSVEWDTGDQMFEGKFLGINKEGDALISRNNRIENFKNGEIRLQKPV